jgi:formylglycine-generating enzyme required for sulfatase activity/serine/threonine protein kinase
MDPTRRPLSHNPFDTDDNPAPPVSRGTPPLPALRSGSQETTRSATDKATTAHSNAPPPALEPGTLRLEAGGRPLPDYELVKKLGEGGFGEVWLAKGAGGFEVALKFVRLGGTASEQERKSLETIKGIRHAHLLVVFGVWELSGHLIVAMELADRSLMDRLDAAVKAGQSGIPQKELLAYMMDAARGLDFLNEKGIIHRDVKPHNLFLSGNSVKVADYGLAKMLHKTTATASTKMTPAYTAPEFLNGQAAKASDQYSLAATYVHLRTNRMVYPGTVLEMMVGHLTKAPELPGLPSEEQAVLRKALAKDPDQRWKSCREFIRALATAGKGGAPLPAAPVVRPEPVAEETVTPPPPKAIPTTRTTPNPPQPARTPPMPPVSKLPVPPAAMPRADGVSTSAKVWIVLLSLFILLGGGTAAALLLLDIGHAPTVAAGGEKEKRLEKDQPPPQVPLVSAPAGSATTPKPAPTFRDEPKPTPPQPQPTKAKEEPKATPPQPTRPKEEPKASKPKEPAPALPARLRMLELEGAVTLRAGRGSSLTLRVERENYEGPVEFRCLDLPPGVTPRFAQQREGMVEVATLTLTAERTAAAGERQVLVRAVMVDKPLIAAAEGRFQLRVQTSRGEPPALEIMMDSTKVAKAQQRAWAEHLELPIKEDNSLGMKLALIPPGRFLMGSPPSEPQHDRREVQHLVQISRPFYMGTEEVTQEQFIKVMGTNPSRFNKQRGGGPEYPVENVTWEQAREFCERLTRLEQHKGRRYRLPTEAEWEYACRAGTTTATHFGARLASTQANFNGMYPYPNEAETPKGPDRQRPQATGSTRPNAWGLHDMHGNVWEWCLDGYQESYYQKQPPLAVDPKNTDDIKLRVLRGGSFYCNGENCRSAKRYGAPPHQIPENDRNQIGFRVVCEIGGDSP